MPVRYLGVVFGVGFVLVALYAISAPYRRARLTSFLDPWAHAGTSGFQAVQGQIALGSGGLFGKGPGGSTQKLFFLPEAHTDFILAIIGEELGVAGVIGGADAVRHVRLRRAAHRPARRRRAREAPGRRADLARRCARRR